VLRRNPRYRSATFDVSLRPAGTEIIGIPGEDQQISVRRCLSASVIRVSGLYSKNYQAAFLKGR
jgi:hypothetical protein